MKKLKPIIQKDHNKNEIFHHCIIISRVDIEKREKQEKQQKIVILVLSLPKPDLFQCQINTFNYYNFCFLQQNLVQSLHVTEVNPPKELKFRVYLFLSGS